MFHHGDSGLLCFYLREGGDISEEKRDWRVVMEAGQAEMVEKKSRFLARVEPAADVKEAMAAVERARKTYWDARHHCFAYVLDQGRTARCSDDGEPAQTAGRPILERLQNAGVDGAVAVVTRYFGGTLLGTGGLVRAYSSAAQAALSACRLGTLRTGTKMRLLCGYADAGKIHRLLGTGGGQSAGPGNCQDAGPGNRRAIARDIGQGVSQGIQIQNVRYTDRVEFSLLVPLGQEQAFERQALDLTQGQAAIEREGPLTYVEPAVK